jgi:outer membrane protein assembly factor BamA
VSLDLTRLNFLGTGQSLSFRSLYSTLQKRAAFSYFVPRIFNQPKLDGTLSLLYDDTHDVRTFQSKREEVSAILAQRVSKPITVFYRFNYRNVDVSNLKIDPLLLPHVAQSVRVGIASFNLVQDRRDDPTDPHKGIYNTLDVGWADRIFGSQTNFVRLLGRNATYYHLGEKIILARETQVGVELPYRVPAIADPTDPIPLPERFYGGGGNTLRGVPENFRGRGQYLFQLADCDVPRDPEGRHGFQLHDPCGRIRHPLPDTGRPPALRSRVQYQSPEVQRLCRQLLPVSAVFHCR